MSSYLDTLYTDGPSVPNNTPSVGSEERDLETGLAKAKEEAQDEDIFSSNQFGTGFDPDTSESSGTYEPQVLNARHREIIRLYALGYKQVTIASILSITTATVGYVVNSPLGRSFLQEIEQARTGSVKDVRDRLQEMSPFAAEIFVDVMSNSKSEARRLAAAEKVLKMTGHTGEQKNLHLHTHLTREELEEIKHEANNGGPETVLEAEIVENESEEQDAI